MNNCLRFVGCLGILVFLSFLETRSDENSLCLDCHGDVDFWDEGARSLYLNEDRYDLSVHGEAELSCTFCHEDLSEEDLPHEEELIPVNCSGCHDSEGEEFEKSVHASGVTESGTSVKCSDCHGYHYILPVDDPRSMMYRANLPLNCSKCHSGEEVEPTGEESGMGEAVRSYLRSVHGKALIEKGLIVSAVCVDCHGSHYIRTSTARSSPMSRENGPATCGKCHTGILLAYNESVHGVDQRRGNPDVPVCTDCHGEHTILAHDTELSSVYPTNVPVTCSHCHDDIKINSRYGLPVNRYKTFMGTYHGIASLLGDVETANCTSCHGIHDIKSSSDPSSSINPKNLSETCGKCHPGASKYFISNKIHVEEVGKENQWAYLAEIFYKIFIPLLIGVFLLFIAVELYGSVKRKRKERI